MESAPDIGMVGPRSNSISGPQAMGTEYDSVEGYQAFAARLANEHRGESSPARRIVGMFTIREKGDIRTDRGMGPGASHQRQGRRVRIPAMTTSPIRMFLAGYRMLIRPHDVLIHQFRECYGHFSEIPTCSEASQNTNMAKYESKLKHDPRIRTGVDGGVVVVLQDLAIPSRCPSDAAWNLPEPVSSSSAGG